MDEQPQAAKVAPVRLQQSPVYNSPIYSANIGQQIANDLNAARQGVVASIILNPPKALEDPDANHTYRVINAVSRAVGTAFQGV